MEDIHTVKYCPWISESINVKQYFDTYHNILDEVNGMKPHNDKFEPKKAIREFFHTPEDLDSHSLRTTPSNQTKSTATEKKNAGEKGGSGKGGGGGGEVVSLKEQLKGNRGINIDEEGTTDENITHFEGEEDENEGEDPFDVDKMEQACSIDLLTCEGELPPRDLCVSGGTGHSGRVTNWYAGEFQDGVVPPAGTSKLAVLASQKQELHKRESIKDYLSLRHRQLKYSKTVRMTLKDETTPEEVSLNDDCTVTCLRETVLNVRIQRPYHKRSFHKKSSNKYPTYSQELLMVGSQKLTELRDAIVCLNDVYIHKNVADNPSLSDLDSHQTSKDLFPSALFYVDKTFFVDTRHPDAKDYSAVIKAWSTRIPDISTMQTKDMSEAIFSNLNIKLGFPYVYQHLGNCEHHITFTDIRLMTRTDIQDVSRYPLSRGNPVKHVIQCYVCQIYKAAWIVRDDPELPVQTAHMCHSCLKAFCYYDEGILKNRNIKVFPFLDEFAALRRIENSNKDSNADESTEMAILES